MGVRRKPVVCGLVLDLRTTVSQKCGAVPKRARMYGGRLVSKDHRRVYHSTLGSRVMEKRRGVDRGVK